ncbi:MAG TPA: hypothetical protein ENG87_05255 [Candidatus Pacearchaeota archaeon]|nr:hypothetical protein BMS3Abin17_00604 [archaeon BMS3Abin17]HDK42764.1 hypothetical protein [Candidatus Pacearchaeota archaeon]HDZ60842.1 hypothetical protein [Candidatus Pacearchaeota archaeon]
MQQLKDIKMGWRHRLRFESESPIECPLCHKGVKVVFIIHSTRGTISQLFMMCPLCKDTFIGEYVQSSRDDVYYFKEFHDYKNPRSEKEFSQNIKDISENFVLIYNEAESAEEFGLKQICGGGYRKAFEFLIKDYLIKKKSPSLKME